ncbi:MULTISPECIES: hypothetical protein [Wolbachia]|nr:MULTISPECIES: hypothetical protein [Wolbachia]
MKNFLLLVALILSFAFDANANTIVLPKVNDKGIISYLSYNGV